MPVLVRYRLTDGLIMGGWEATTDAMLRAQIPAEDATYGYLIDAEDRALAELSAAYGVQEGRFVAKVEGTITATPHPFAADGVTPCTVTVDPFVPCTLLVDGTPYALVPEDQAVILLSETPYTFHISLQPMAAYRAAAITVEAT